ncbi:hypothetical protein BCR36DRAFT_167234 [Piromyces finnis]|uniref:Uncharacterized protein n=1 Tax=Piromyces finnis TaxID=1754191 RepID=A0A1Y1UVY0_9FUNG|nr:hypothetical protein BCR36DRAFT_167234 [Piromyces finnis]|eukprot:ORX42094.1 hypothetical protein BCR36DRAFT_167234 [Piromyces finnis]
MIDGQFVEEWFMCCDAIPSSRCTGNNVQPAWVNSYKFPSGAQRAPLVKEVEYPSWIFTPSNMKNSIGWNYNSYLRKRGVWSGEECFNEDLVKPNANVTNFDLRKIEKRDEDEENIGFSDHSKHEKREESSSVINSISKIAEIIIAIVTIVFLYNI